MRIAHRIAAVSIGIALAFGGFVVVAPSAAATAQGCFYYLLESHPDVDLAVAEAACSAGAQDGEEEGDENIRACYAQLRGGYVPAVIALNACRRAASD